MASAFCSNCAAPTKPHAKFCTNCGHPVATANTTAATQATPFITSPSKLAVLSVATWGIYSIYWAYKQWSYLRASRQIKIRPLLRSIFLPLFAYSLFKQLKSPRPGRYAITYIVLAVSGTYPESWTAFVSSLSFLPLVWVQQQINAEYVRDGQPNSKWSAKAITGLILGLIGWFVFILISLGLI